jgi:hypothetical protein
MKLRYKLTFKLLQIGSSKRRLVSQNQLKDAEDEAVNLVSFKQI